MTQTEVVIEGTAHSVQHKNGEIITIDHKHVSECDLESLDKVYKRLFPDEKENLSL